MLDPADPGSGYVPERIDPVIGIASCNNVLVVVLSSFKTVLKVVAIYKPLNSCIW